MPSVRLVLLTVVAVILLLQVNVGAAVAQDEAPIAAPPPPLTDGVEDRLPSNQRHPCCFGAPFPLNIAYIVGQYLEPNGQTTTVTCGIEVGTDTPYAPEGNTRYIKFVGGNKCNHDQVLSTGKAELWNYQDAVTPNEYKLADGNTYSVTKEGVSYNYYNRTSDFQNQTIRLRFTLTFAGNQYARWNSIAGNTRCTGMSTRTITCEHWSAPFKYAPYAPDACPSGQIGLKPNCNTPPPACPSGQFGVQPYCVTPPTRPECTGPVLPDDSPDTHCPEDEDVPGKWGPEDGPFFEPEGFREEVEQSTGRLPGEPLPGATAAAGNPNNNSDPHFVAEDTALHGAGGKHIGAFWCNSGYRVRRRWCYTARPVSGRTTVNGGAQKLKSTTARAVYVCFQFSDGYPVPQPDRKRYETCGTNIAKTGFVRPGTPMNGGWVGECEHFHVKRQWVSCTYEYGTPQ